MSTRSTYLRAKVPVFQVHAYLRPELTSSNWRRTWELHVHVGDRSGEDLRLLSLRCPVPRLFAADTISGLVSSACPARGQITGRKQGWWTCVDTCLLLGLLTRRRRG